MDKNARIVAVCGPTASGKTAVAARLALALDGEVVSADSMQVYRHMDIGAAKPSAEETLGVPHHLIDVLEPDESFSVADYVALAKKAVDSIRKRGKLPVLAGGTGLYISSFLSGMRFEDMGRDLAVRQELERTAREMGGAHLLALLAETDPELAEKLHPNDKGRIIRGLEAYRVTGVKMSELQRRARESGPEYEAVMVGLTFSDRQKLYDRINSRVDVMIGSGLEEEARRLYGRYSGTAAQAIGYKEFEPYFAGEATLYETAEKIKMETRRYAKRQLTWFRRDSRVKWFHMDEPEAVEKIISYVHERISAGKEDPAP